MPNLQTECCSLATCWIPVSTGMTDEPLLSLVIPAKAGTHETTPQSGGRPLRMEGHSHIFRTQIDGVNLLEIVRVEVIHRLQMV